MAGPTSRWVIAAWVLVSAGTALAGEEGTFRFAERPNGRLQILDGERPVLTYNRKMQLKEGVPESMERACYVHPIRGPDGEVITGDFPDDHHHHRGLSWMWPNVKARGKWVDLWHIQGIRQHFRRWIEREAGEDQATIAVENDWLMSGERVATERVRLTVHEAREKGRAIDVALRFTAVGGPMVLQGEKANNKGYGGLCLRFGPRKETTITTNEGAQPEDSLRTPYRWADLSAQFRGREEMSGIAVFVHPDHPDAPIGWILRHYGFLGAEWPGVEKTTLHPGEPVTLRYRLWVHEGDAKEGRVAEAYARYRQAVGGEKASRGDP